MVKRLIASHLLKSVPPTYTACRTTPTYTSCLHFLLHNEGGLFIGFFRIPFFCKAVDRGLLGQLLGQLSLEVSSRGSSFKLRLSMDAIS